MFKNLGNLASMLKHAQTIGSRMQGLAEELRGRRATAAAGGGLVEVEVNGLGEMLRCRIDAGLFAQQDRELIEDLIVAAANQAQAKAKEMHAEALKNATGDLELPGLDEALAKMKE